MAERASETSGENTVRLRGKLRARGSSRLSRSVLRSIEDKTSWSDLSTHADFELDTGVADAPLVTIDTSGKPWLETGAAATKGTWSKLRERARKLQQPGDFAPEAAEVELTEHAFADGAELVIHGVILEERFAPDVGGVRAAAVSQPLRLRALVIAGGPDAEARSSAASKRWRDHGVRVKARRSTPTIPACVRRSSSHSCCSRCSR